MERYTINGVEVEHDTFDLDQMERLEEAVRRVKEDMSALRDRTDGEGSAIELLREQAEVFLDFFDDVLGEGSARKIFGGRVNIRDISNGYTGFINDVAAQQAKLAGTMGQPELDRAQRRARR